MKVFTISIFLFLWISIHAQIPPILDHTWTIEKIDTGSQIITADLNPFGEFDTFTLNYIGMSGNNFFYELIEVFFGHCQFYLSFDATNSDLYYHLEGCTLSNQDSSQIALYFNQTFIQQNTNLDNSFPDTFPATFGPLTYSFTTVGDLIYLDITNSIGEVATFYAQNLSQDAFLKDAIRIYPNPVADVLLIDSSIVAIENLDLYDMNGRLVEKYDTINAQIDVSHLQHGVYILEISTSIGVLREKLVKK